MVRFGIIGIGNMGSSYCGWLRDGVIPNGTLTAVADIAEPRRQWARENLPEQVAVFTDADSLIESGLTDAVMVVTPHYFHCPIAIKALQHGLHVIVDKPAGVYTKQIQEMNDEAARHPQLKFAMMFNQRTNPLYKRLKAILDNGEIGEIRRVNWVITSWWRTQVYYNSSAWRATWWGEGGGVLVNQAPHQLDLLQWLCGMPSKARGYLRYGAYREITVEDDVAAYLQYPNGASGVFVTCTHDACGTDRLDIEGSCGKIIVDNGSTARVMRLTKPESVLSEELDFRTMLAMVKGQAGEKLYEEETFSYPENWDQQHIDVIINFAAAVEQGIPLIAPGSDGIRAVQISNALHLSSWLDREVDLPVDGDLFYEKLQEKIGEERR